MNDEPKQWLEFTDWKDPHLWREYTEWDLAEISQKRKERDGRQKTI